ncbi:MAG: hypothetical protein IIB36_20195 [Gemmatimonadetes bacterium]|nr:hypothetical protein [Gemmatimonadota bacterium]
MDEQPREAFVAVQSLLAQSARASLVLLLHLDQGVECSQIVVCHGMCFPRPTGRTEHPDYAD